MLIESGICIYKLWIKWKGYDEISPRWRHELLKETSNPEILVNIDQRVQEAKERHRIEHGSTEADDIDDLETSVPPNVAIHANVLPPQTFRREGPVLRSRTTKQILPIFLAEDDNMPTCKLSTLEACELHHPSSTLYK